MSRKRKSTEILAQLGEPLPLPYRANTTSVKPDQSVEKPPVSGYLQTHDPIRKRRLFERRDFSGSATPAPVAETRHVADEHVPLPIWRRDRAPLKSEPSDSESEPLIEREETFLDRLQSQLDSLRTLYDSKDAVDADEDQLVKVSAMLEQMAERKRKESIVYELERIQKMALRVETPKSNNWKVAFWMLVVVLMLFASFLAGYFSYEYLYVVY